MSAPFFLALMGRTTAERIGSVSQTVLYQGMASQDAEKLVAMKETADSSGLKPLGMTKIKGLQWRT